MTVTVAADFDKLYTRLVQCFGDPVSINDEEQFMNYIFKIRSRRDVEGFIDLVLDAKLMSQEVIRSVIETQKSSGNLFSWDDMNLNVESDIEISVEAMEDENGLYYSVFLIYNDIEQPPR